MADTQLLQPSALQVWCGAAQAYLKQADAAVIGTLKREPRLCSHERTPVTETQPTDSHVVLHSAGGVVLASEHEVAAMAGGAAAAAILLPAPRRLLWRLTLGRLRSPEAAYKSAELKVATLAEKVEAQGGEVQKLSERLGLAQEEYKRGLAKLKATASELRSLEARVGATERSAKGETAQEAAADGEGTCGVTTRRGLKSDEGRVGGQPRSPLAAQRRAEKERFCFGTCLSCLQGCSRICGSFAPRRRCSCALRRPSALRRRRGNAPQWRSWCAA